MTLLVKAVENHSYPEYRAAVALVQVSHRYLLEELESTVVKVAVALRQHDLLIISGKAGIGTSSPHSKLVVWQRVR